MENERRFRKLFVKYLTEDSKTQDIRRKDFNQAIFDEDEGWACFVATDLRMILGKFDMAVKELDREEREVLKNMKKRDEQKADYEFTLVGPKEYFNRRLGRAIAKGRLLKHLKEVGKCV